MVTNSPPKTGTMTGSRTTTVLRCTARLGGGMVRAGLTVAGPILTVCTTTHPGPQISLGLSGWIGMVCIIL